MPSPELIMTQFDDFKIRGVERGDFCTNIYTKVGFCHVRYSHDFKLDLDQGNYIQ